jgi:hypothetical protein
LAPASAGLAALVLGATSRGDIVVLAVLLAVASASHQRALAVGMACTAALVRWGSSSLGAIAGAQAVLGPAGWTGDAAAVTASWLTAVALVCCVPVWPAEATRGRVRHVSVLVASAPFAIAAADLTVGPAPGGAVVARLIASLVAVAIAAAVTSVASDDRTAHARTRAAIVFGVAALALAGLSG